MQFAEAAKSCAKRQTRLLPDIAHLPPDEQQNIMLRGALDQISALQLTAQGTARRIAIEAIREGYLSRVEAAEMLGVHQGTVARWVKEDSTQKIKHASTTQRTRETDKNHID